MEPLRDPEMNEPALSSWQKIIGCEAGLRQTILLAQKMALADEPILIEGPTGTGKTLLARTIHENSGRSRGPFIEIPCSSLNENLIESELFGHVRGAFTGAQAHNHGKLLRAHGGTLFLDEIGELPLSAQSRLLHFLQDGYFYRVGSNHMEYIDVRLIAATNRNLIGMIREGSFREDLFFRLAVLRLQVPSLTERRQDILPLVTHTLAEFGRKTGREVLLSEKALLKILEHDWPGNIRELQNVLKRALVCSAGDKEKIDDIDIDACGDAKILELLHQNLRGFLLPEPEWGEIQRALLENQGCLQKAAATLGVSRYALYRKLKKWGISKNSALTSAVQKIDRS